MEKGMAILGVGLLGLFFHLPFTAGQTVSPPDGLGGLATAPPVKFVHLSTAEGLSQSTVLCAAQDRLGFLWFGTQDGLNRYDGYGFTVFRHDDADPGSLRDNYILSLYVDREGVLWVGTNKGGLNRYDPATETFTAFVNDPNDPESLSLNAVTAMAEDAAGNFWVATDGQGVNRFDRRTGKFTRFRLDPAIPENRRLNIVLAVLPDPAGMLWLGTALGLCEMNLRTYEIRRYPHDPAAPQGLSQDRVVSISRDRAGALWLGTVAGLDKIDPGSGRVTQIRHDPANPHSLAGGRGYRIRHDRNGVLWIAGSQGLDRFDEASGRFLHHRADPNQPGSLRGDRLYDLYEDRAGSLWVSVQQAGLCRYDPQAIPFLNFPLKNDKADGLRDRYVRAFAEDRAGHLWVSHTLGIDVFDPVTGRFSPLPVRISVAPPAELKGVNVIAEDAGGRRWLATGNNLYCLEEQAGKWGQAEVFRMPGTIHALRIARDGTIWIGSHGGGLIRLDPATRQIAAFVHDPQNPRSLSHNLVYFIYEDRQNNLWIATDQGLNRLDRATGQFTAYLNDPKNPASLSYNLVWTIYEDRAGRLWIGTGNGLNLLDRATGTFSRLSEKNGLPNANILSILEDDRGRLWLGTFKGVTRYDPGTMTSRNFDRIDGLFGNETEPGAAFRHTAGMLFFGGADGFSAFHPDRIREEATPPPVAITSCRRYNTDVAGGLPLLEKGIAARPEIEFSYKDNLLAFEFAALHFRQSEKNQYAYQLAGYSDRWIQLGTKRDVTFTNLDPGEYTLHIRAANCDGVWNMQGAMLRIRIIPPFWQRWWFVGLEILAAFGLAYGAYRWRIHTLQQRNVRQQEFSRQLIESQEAERKRIAVEMHDSLGQDLLVIKNQALLHGMKIPDEESRRHFTDFSAMVSRALEEVRTISHNLRPPHLDQLGLQTALIAMIEQVDGSSDIHFSHEIGEIDGMLAPGEDIILYRIVQESLANILKHSGATEAEVTLRIEDGRMVLRIRDDGRGFPPESLAGKGRGLGLPGIAERARILGGDLAIHSTPGQGSLLILRINLSQN